MFEICRICVTRLLNEMEQSLKAPPLLRSPVDVVIVSVSQTFDGRSDKKTQNKPVEFPPKNDNCQPVAFS